MMIRRKKTTNQLDRERGISLIAVIIAMLLLSLLGTVLVSIVTTERYAGTNQMQAMSAQYLAEAGLDRALHYFFNEGQSCGTTDQPPGTPPVFNATLGGGSFTVNTHQYNPTALTLTAALNETDISFAVSDNVATAGYAPYGIVIIDQEYLECAQATGTQFKNCKRGVGGTTPASHKGPNDPNPGDVAANVFQDFCIVNSTGTIASALSNNAQRVVSIGFSQFDQGYAVGDNGTILQWNGAAWSAATSPTGRILRTVKLTALDRGWIGGDSGVMGQLSGGPWTKQRSAYLYLPANGGNDIAVFDTDPHEVGSCPCPPGGRVGYISNVGGATEVALTPNGKYLYVTRNAANNVVVIDADTHAVVFAIAGIAGPRGLAISTDGTRVYVVSEGSKKIWVIRRNNDTDPTQDDFDLDPQFSQISFNDSSVPRYIGLTPDGKKAFVTTSTSGLLEVIDGLPGDSIPPPIPPTKTAIPLADEFAQPETDQWGIAIDSSGSYAYVAGRGTDRIFAINAMSNTLIEPIPAGGTPWHISYTQDGKGAYVSKNNVKKILVLDTGSQTTTTNVGVDDGPAGIATSADGSEIYVATTAAGGRVNVIRVADQTTGVGENVPGLTGGITAAPATNFRSLSMLGPSEGWAVGDDGRMLHWTVTPPATTPAWVTQPLVTMPTATLPPNTQPAGEGIWKTTIEPEQDTYVRMNDDDPACGGSGCNGDPYNSLDPQRLGLRRYWEDANDPNNVNNSNNQRIYRPYLKFDLGIVKQYAKSVSDAQLKLYAYEIDPVPSGTVVGGPSLALVLRYRFEDCYPPPPTTTMDPTTGRCSVAVPINDATANANNGTFCENAGVACTGNPSYGAGVEGVALKFDGMGNRVIRASNNSLAMTAQLSVDTWVNFSDPAQLVPNVDRELLRKGLTSSEFSYMLWVTGGKPAFRVRVGGVVVNAVSPDPFLLQAHRWYHLVGTYDGSNVKIYQDGILKDTEPASGSIFKHGSGPPPLPSSNCDNYQTVLGSAIKADALCIGGSTSAGFDGLLDETRIYNQALTAEQVQQESGWGERVVDVYNVEGSWDNGLTGDTQPPFGQKFNNPPVDVTTEYLPQWLYWTVTSLVQGWVDDTYSNDGVVLRVGLKSGKNDPSPNGILWVYSVDAPDDSYRPRLVVTYNVSRRPNLESVAMLETDSNHPGADDGWAVGVAGVVFRYNKNNNGIWSLWTDTDQTNHGGPPLPTKGLKSVSMRDNTEGWAVGDEGTILHFTGGHWQVFASPTSKDLTAVSIAPNGWGIAVGKNGTILSYNGTNWISDPSATNNPNLLAIKAFSNAKGWGAGEDGTIVRKRGGIWHAPGDPGPSDPGTEKKTPNHLRGIDMLPSQTTVTDWRENY